MAKQDKTKLDPLRSMIMVKAGEYRHTLKALSSAAGKNSAYMHQFIWRESPKALPEDVRNIIGPMLDIAPDLLRSGRFKTGAPMAAPSPASIGNKISICADPKQVPGLRRPEGVVPIYACPGVMDEAAAIEWVEAPGHYAGAGTAFGIWITEDGSRFQAGDMVFIRPAQPARQGDVAVIAKDNNIIAIGEVVSRDDKAVIIRSNAGEKTYLMAKHRIMKITAAVFR